MKKLFCLVFATMFLLASVVHAEVKNYTGVGEYIISMKETLEFGYKNAQLYAERNAIEEAGIFISSESKVIGAKLQKDEVITFTAGVMKNISVQKREMIPLTGESEGYIKIRVTVTASIDTKDFDSAL